MNSGRRTARQELESQIPRRNAELRKQEHWNSVAEYFKSWNVQASKYAAWTSNKYFRQNEEARVEAEKKEQKMHLLTERRNKLKQFLENEERKHEEELRNLNCSSQLSWKPLDDLKSINVELKRRSEESRKREAELLLYQRWKQEQPTLRDLERKQHLEFMKKSWIDQVKEREIAKEKQKAEEALRVKEEELKCKEEEELEQLHQRRKNEELKNLKEQIKLQVKAIKDSVKEYNELEKLNEEERKIQNEVEQMIMQRKLSDQKKANKELAAYWNCQFQLKLKKKAKEVEEEILQDQKMLEKLQQELNQEAQARAHLKEITKKEMELALKELETHRERELLRKEEYEHMFFEDAKRVWGVQERRWFQEQQARDRLMKEVLETIKKQVKEKVARNSAKQAESLIERDLLLKEVGELHEECKRRELEIKRSQKQYCNDLDLQITEKTIEKARKAQEEAELERKRALAEAETENRLAMEARLSTLNINNYKPPNFRRKRVVW